MKKRIDPAGGPKALGPYSPAIATDSLVFVSGQIPIHPETGELVEGDIGEQVHQIMRNVELLLREAGSSLEKVVKTTIFLKDIADFEAVNEVYGSYFQGLVPPARSTVQAVLPKDVGVEIEVIALA